MQELTRLGMKENEMKYVAELIKRVAVDGDIEGVKKDVKELKEEFNTIHYCFNEGVEAYKFLEIVK